MANGDEPRPAAAAGNQPDRLESWKEIATYLHRDVTTVQRWEKQEGLPVHRLQHQKLGSVYALKSEIDAWRDRAQRRRPVAWRRLWWLAAVFAIAVVLLLAAVRRDVVARWVRNGRDAAASGSREVPREDRGRVDVLPLASDPGDEAEPAMSPDGRFVAYLWDTNTPRGDYDIYVKQIDGGRPVRVAPCRAPTDCTLPEWSPDGQQLAFLKREPGEPPDGRAGVFLVPVLGGPERRIGTVRVTPDGLSWFPDGTALAVVSADGPTGNRRISVLSVATANLRPFSNPPNGWSDRSPAVSPDGRTVAFLRQRIDWPTHVLLTQAVTAAEAVAIDIGQERVGVVDWLPGSRELLVSAAGKLFRVPLGGGRPVQLPIEARVAGFSVSRTVPRVALVTNGTSRDIWRVTGPAAPNRTAPARASLSSTLNEVRAEYSPDGHRVAFVTNRSGRSEVWTCDVDESHCGPVPVPARFEGQDRPSWSPDGRRILFEGALSGEQISSFFVLDLESGTMQKVSACPPNSRNGVWASDGAHLYFSPDDALQLGVWKAPVDGSAPSVRVLDDRNTIPVAEQGGYLYLARFTGTSPEQLTMGIWRLSLRDGRKEQIPGAAWSRYAVWHGKIVALEQHRNDLGTSLVLIDPATHARRVLNELGPYAIQPTVSPDGRWVLFTRIVAERDLLLLDLKR